MCTDKSFTNIRETLRKSAKLVLNLDVTQVKGRLQIHFELYTSFTVNVLAIRLYHASWKHQFPQDHLNVGHSLHLDPG